MMPKPITEAEPLAHFGPRILPERLELPEDFFDLPDYSPHDWDDWLIRCAGSATVENYVKLRLHLHLHLTINHGDNLIGAGGEARGQSEAPNGHLEIDENWCISAGVYPNLLLNEEPEGQRRVGAHGGHRQVQSSVLIGIAQLAEHRQGVTSDGFSAIRLIPLDSCPVFRSEKAKSLCLVAGFYSPDADRKINLSGTDGLGMDSKFQREVVKRGSRVIQEVANDQTQFIRQWFREFDEKPCGIGVLLLTNGIGLAVGKSIRHRLKSLEMFFSPCQHRLKFRHDRRGWNVRCNGHAWPL